MVEHCITFFKEEPNGGNTSVFHCHVTAEDSVLAVTTALHEAVCSNISIVEATFMEVRLLIELPPGLTAEMEGLRQLKHGGKPAATPKTPDHGHLH